jgi:hypothetical protein
VPPGSSNAPGRLDEERPVHVVHRREVIHVREVDGRADNVPIREAAALQERSDIFKDTVSLGFDVAVDHGAGHRVKGHLAGNEQKRICPER